MPLHEELLQLLTAYGDGAKEKRLGLVRLTKVPQQASEVAEARRGIRMLGAKHLLVDRQRALLERPRPREVALGLQQAGEVVEATRRIRMLGAKHPSRYGGEPQQPRTPVAGPWSA